jgi:hypothetical protein
MDILPELKSYLQRKRWQWKPTSGTDIAVKTCPFCGRSKWKFNIHATKTMYRCWHCDARGNLYKLKRELGDLQGVVSASQAVGEGKRGSSTTVDMDLIDKWHRQLLKHALTLSYLTEGRGFEAETVAHFKLGLQKQNGQLWLAIPHISGGVCHNVKFRSLPPAEKTFRRVKGAASTLFNADVLAEHGSVVIAEAETDAMSLWQAGVKNVVGLTCGADTFLPEWYDNLADKEEVTICLDADVVGQQGARAIARRLGFDKSKNVLLPYHDANEMLVQVGGPELKRVIEGTAELFEVSGVVTAADAMLRCKETAETGEVGLLTPWDDVNLLLGPGWHPGDLIVLSARVKVGKTTLSLNLADHHSRMGVPSLIYCLEMSVERLGEKVAALIRHKPVDDLTGVDYELARHRLRNQPLYFVEPDWGGSLKDEVVRDKIREAVKRHGIKFVVFDHLHFLCRSLQFLTAEVGQVTRAFKLLAQELNVVILLIAQPKKIEGSRVIKYDDIKDSSSIPADCDQIILLHRNARPVGFDEDSGRAQASDQEVLEPKTLLRIDAARFRGGGECFLYYDGASSLFTGWEDRPAREP